MKARFVSDYIFEFKRSDSTDNDVKTAIGIGNPLARMRNMIKEFAEKNKYEFVESKASLRLRVPIKYKEKYDAGSRESKTFNVESMEYTVTFPQGWTETPMSLRKRWLGVTGSGVKQNLMGRFSDPRDVIERIQTSIKNEMKKANPPDKKAGEELLDAVYDNDLNKVNTLLISGVSPNHSVKSNIERNIPLIIAAKKRNLDIVKALVEAGADVNVVSKEGKTPLSEILGFEPYDLKDLSITPKIVNYLFSKGAKVQGSNLYWGLQFTPPLTVETFLKNVKLEEFPEKELGEILTSYAWMGGWKNLKLFLDKGADPNTKGNQGDLLQTAISGKNSIGRSFGDHERNYDKTIKVIKDALSKK
jgi:hypothetical protein